MKILIINRIMSAKKTTLPCLRYQDRKIVKTEIENIYKLFTNISIKASRN